MRLLSIIGLPLFVGCVSLTTLQQPKIVEPGTIRGGMGLSVLGSYGPMSEINARVGVVNNIDIGTKIDANATNYYLDVRYQFLKEPFFIAGGLGYAEMALSVPSNPNGPSSFVKVIQPFLLAGGEHWYIGIRPFYSNNLGKLNWIQDDLRFQSNQWSMVSITLGGCINIKTSKLFLEVNQLRFSDGKTIFLPALGIQGDVHIF